jgi:membrane associated rhomboid family serine protease
MSFDGNQYRPSGFGFLPVVTKNIIIINVILFLAKVVLAMRGISLEDHLGLHDHLSPTFRPHQFITYIFMHADFMHLFLNMFGVFIFGQVLEQVWGPKRFLVFYILTGLGAALVQYCIMHVEITDLFSRINQAIEEEMLGAARTAELIELKDQILRGKVVVGASGSLFGLLGGFGMLFPNRYLYLYFFFPIKAKWFVVLYGALEIVSAIQNNPNDPVAHFAHIGGLVVGVILVLVWRRDRSNFY